MFTPLLAVAQPPSFGTAVIDALITVLVVFAVLCLLSAIIWLFGRLGERKKAPVQKAVSKPAAPALAQAEDEGEVIAAIGAAVAMMAPAGKAYQVKKITPVQGQIIKGQAVQRRSEWAAAAVRQNTAPF